MANDKGDRSLFSQSRISEQLLTRASFCV